MGTWSDEAEAAERIRTVMSVAVDVLGSSRAAHTWLDTPLDAVRGARPSELVAASEAGMREVLTTLGRIDHGVYS